MTLLSQRREVGEFKKRYKWMALAVLATFLILVVRVTYLQVANHEEYAAIARENITKTITLPATRGLLRDTDGRVIASNRPAYNVYVTPQLIRPGDIEAVAELMGLDEEGVDTLWHRLNAAEAPLVEAAAETTVQEQLASLTERLELNPGQVEAVRPILTRLHREREELLELPRELRRERARFLHDDTRRAMADVLSDEQLSRVPRQRRTHQIEMLTEIDRDQLAALETHSNELPGVDVVAVPVRTYPYGNLSAHAVGYLNEVSAEDLERLDGQDYRAGDTIGRTGVERAWEPYLHGQRGHRRVLVDARGSIQHTEDLAGAELRREPVPGRDLRLTLDMELMESVERAFRGHPSGAAVVVDVRTGGIRALFSKPAYDLNEMTGRLTQDRYDELREDPFRPLIDKTLYESYFPGSTFKPISALAALGDDVLDPSARADCHGFYEIGNRRFRCSTAHGDVDMRRALVQSCNVYFWKLAEQVGLDRLNRYATDFGLGERTGIGINSEASGFLATRDWYRERHGNRFMVGFTLNTAIGQGNTRVTLLQLAMAYAAIANGGTLYRPQLIESVEAPDGTVIEEFGPRVRRRVHVAREHLTYVIDGLYGVVNDPSGTAYDARVEGGVPVAGKTGTAQVARRRPRTDDEARRAWYFNRDHAWFAGFAPAGDPEVAVVVLVEHGGGGGRYAAPLATQILQEYLGADETTASNGAPTGSPTVLARGAN